MKKNLSYSGYTTYVTCPKKYDYHYNQKIDSETTPSHLIFGSAVDKALNVILSGGTDEEALAATYPDLARLATEKIEIQEQDFDGDLIINEEKLVRQLQTTGWTGTNPTVLATTLFEKIKFGETLSANQSLALALLVRASFFEKIALIIQAFHDYVEPQIEEIVSVQKNVKRGILDFEAKLHGHDGIVVCDNKTASRDYPEDAVRMSVQLAGYGAKKGCYVVFNKTVKKNRTKTCSVCGANGTGKRHKTCDAVIDGDRCNGDWDETISPEIIPQIIIDDIKEETREMVETAYAEVEALIETGIFPRNLNSCGKQFGRPCDYINLCWNKDIKGLVKK
jgi:hypothetical protein